MAKSVKLPHLPDTEPEGSMAEYLTIARAKQDQKALGLTAIDPLSASDDVRLGHLSVVTDELAKPENSQFEQPDNSPLGDVSPPDLSEKTATEPSPDQVEGPAYQSGIKMSKILDKTPLLTSGEIPPSKDPKFSRDERSQQQPNKPRSTRNGTGSGPSALIQYIQGLPEIFKNSMNSKGEVKVRITEQMVYLLQMISQSGESNQRIRFFSENLINELLREFLVRYAPEIDQLTDEFQKQEVARQQQRMIGIKRILTK